MYLAIKGNKQDSIRFLLARNIPIHFSEIGKSENSPVFYAIRQNNLQALELLCDRNT